MAQEEQDHKQQALDAIRAATQPRGHAVSGPNIDPAVYAQIAIAQAILELARQVRRAA
jgi:hypothetical protein